jgi:phage terminase large subunit-like protein
MNAGRLAGSLRSRQAPRLTNLAMEALAPSLGGLVCDWIAAYLVHGPGDVQGQPIELDDEVAAFIWRAYELRDGDHQRQYRRAFLSRPKGRGKSELAAMLACAELLGPVRFDGFDARGQPVGRPITAPEVLCIATEEGQAGFVYQSARYMLEHGRAGDDYLIDTGLTRTYLAGGGSLEPVTAAANSKDGGRSTFVVADETHLWVTPELRRLHATVKRNIVKRRIGDGWMLETSTAFRPGEGSVAEGAVEVFRLIESGEIEDPTLLVDHRAAPSDVDIHDPQALRAALVSVYGGAAAWTNLDGILAEFSDPTTDESDNRRYWLNQIIRASDQWMDPDAWAQRGAHQVVEDGEVITLGFDGSIRDDATALVACRARDGYLFVIDVWEKPEGSREWQVDRGEVDAAMADAMQRYHVVRAYCDPWQWHDTLDRWSVEWPKVVISWPTNRDRAMAFALERLRIAVITGDMLHAEDARLTRHVLNARRKPVRAGDLIFKDTQHSPRKIDAAIAAVLAYEARADALAAGELTPKRSGFAFL